MIQHTYMKLVIAGFTLLSFISLAACTSVKHPKPQKTKKFLYQYTLYSTDTKQGKEVINETGGHSWVLAHTPYFLEIHNHPLTDTQKGSYNGVTDSNGKTITVLSDKEIEIEDVTLTERYGEGDLGQLFVITDQNQEPIEGMSYHITVKCPNSKLVIINGQTNSMGFTKYIASTQVCDLLLFSGNLRIK